MLVFDGFVLAGMQAGDGLKRRRRASATRGFCKTDANQTRFLLQPSTRERR